MFFMDGKRLREMFSSFFGEIASLGPRGLLYHSRLKCQEMLVLVTLRVFIAGLGSVALG